MWVGQGNLGRMYVLQRWWGVPRPSFFPSEVKQAPIRYKYGYFTPRFQPIYDVDTCLLGVLHFLGFGFVGDILGDSRTFPELAPLEFNSWDFTCGPH